jgi:hydrogenase maturation protease
MARVKVVGLGSHHGDDRAGWHVVEMLSGAADSVVLGDPSQLLDHLEGCDRLIVVDACRSGQVPGTIFRFAWPPDAALATLTEPSSHGLGAATVLTLAETLGRLPPSVVLYAVEVQSCAPNEPLSPAVSAALPELCRRVRQELSMVTLDVLRGIRFLQDIPDNHLQALAAIAEIKDLPAGTVVFREGQRSASIYLVIEGNIAVEICAPGVGCTTVYTVGAGELLGWSPLLGSGPVRGTSRVMAPSRVLAVNAGQVLALCAHDLAFGMEFMRRTAQALAFRLDATRLQLLDVYRHELRFVPLEGDQE